MEEAEGGGVIPVWACWTGLDPRCSTEVVRFELVTRASPEQVLRALTDFSDRRVHTWSRTLDPKTYEVREQGDTWAVARESTPGSPYWVVARYDWSDPAVVRWVTVPRSASWWRNRSTSSRNPSSSRGRSTAWSTVTALTSPGRS